jgi:ACS family tartrate transporter-like MFS transporter
MVTAIGNFGGFIGPWFVGAVKGATGSVNGAFLALGAAALCSGILILVIGRHKAFATYRRPAVA